MRPAKFAARAPDAVVASRSAWPVTLGLRMSPSPSPSPRSGGTAPPHAGHAVSPAWHQFRPWDFVPSRRPTSGPKPPAAATPDTTGKSLLLEATTASGKTTTPSRTKSTCGGPKHSAPFLSARTTHSGHPTSLASPFVAFQCLGSAVAVAGPPDRVPGCSDLGFSSATPFTPDPAALKWPKRPSRSFPLANRTFPAATTANIAFVEHCGGDATKVAAGDTSTGSWKAEHKAPRPRPVLADGSLSESRRDCVCGDRPGRLAARHFQKPVSSSWHQHFNEETGATEETTTDQMLSLPEKADTIVAHFGGDHSKCVNRPGDEDEPECRTNPSASRKGRNANCKPHVDRLLSGDTTTGSTSLWW